MEGTIYNHGGVKTALPPLLSWNVEHGFGSPCDSFEVSFLYAPAMFETLTAACRFTAEHGGETVFSGVVDEAELCADSGGCTAVLRGRGLQALLLDNEAEAADYYGAAADFILARHAAPFGIRTGDAVSARADMTVAAGESHWSVLSRFAEFGAGVKPRFRPDGTLLLNGKSGGRRLVINGRTAVSAQTYVQDRYGVLSQATVKNRVLKTSVTVKNDAFLALGGCCGRVVSVPRKTSLDAMRHTAKYQLSRSAEELVRASVTVPELFAAFPGDTAELTDTPLGIAGDFLVWQTRCWADGRSAGTAIELVKK